MQTHRGEVPQLRPDGLQISENRALQERVWTVERVSWWALGAIVLVGLSGLLGGDGPLAHGTVASAGGSAEYPRVGRWLRSDTLEVRFAGEGPRHRLLLAEPFGAGFEITRIEPQPVSAATGPRGLIYDFAAEGAPPAPVRLTVRPRGPRLVRYAIGLDGAAPAAARTLVLP